MSERRLGVIGDPIVHSLSPALFDLLLMELGLSQRYRYEAFRVRPPELASFLGWARKRMSGLNVTIPHKERIVQLLDRIEGAGRMLGAVNTVANENGALVGHNTDAAGFRRSLEDRNVDLAGGRVVVLGAGGAARAVVHALVEMGAGEVIVANRTPERAEQLAEHFARQAVRGNASVVSPLSLTDPRLPELAGDARLVVNATPAGMHPETDAFPLFDLSCLSEGVIVYDLIYNPPETLFLREARSRGAETVGGVDMLVYQGLASLRIWEGEGDGNGGGFTVPASLIEKARARLNQLL